jgi:hypothetical protein
VRGHPRPATLKANVFFAGGWFSDGEISYAGPNAEARARLGAQIIKERMGNLLPLRFDLIGVTSILGDDSGRMFSRTPTGHATDVRLRVAGTHATDEAAVDRLMREVTALWTAGPAGGGGARVTKRKRLSTTSCYIPRELVPARLGFVE